MERHKVRVGITHGDINGIGYEVIFKAFAEPGMLDVCTPVIYGSPKAAAYHRKAIDSQVAFTTVASAEDIAEGRLNMVECYPEEVKIDFGQPTPESGRAAFLALERAVEDYKAGLIDAVVTAPINKKSIQSADFHFPGHTEYFEDRVGGGSKALMVLANSQMRVALATTHLPLSQVAQAITPELLLEKLRLFQQSLRVDFRISIPRIAVLSLNPHAGDGGLLGMEEAEKITPAIQQANSEGIHAFGPYAADGFFGAGMYHHFDGILAMYHDQGLAPFKALSMSDGVNITAGLPLVRTSPDHGLPMTWLAKALLIQARSVRRFMQPSTFGMPDVSTQKPMPIRYVVSITTTATTTLNLRNAVKRIQNEVCSHSRRRGFTPEPGRSGSAKAFGAPERRADDRPLAAHLRRKRRRRSGRRSQ